MGASLQARSPAPSAATTQAAAALGPRLIGERAQPVLPRDDTGGDGRVVRRQRLYGAGLVGRQHAKHIFRRIEVPVFGRRDRQVPGSPAPGS